MTTTTNLSLPTKTATFNGVTYEVHINLNLSRLNMMIYKAFTNKSKRSHDGPLSIKLIPLEDQ